MVNSKKDFSIRVPASKLQILAWICDCGLQAATATGCPAADLTSRVSPLAGAPSTLSTAPEKIHWWRRFTGAQLEYDVHFEGMRRAIEALALDGQHDHEKLGRHIARMRSHHQLMATELALLEEEIGAGHLLASPAWAARRSAAGMDQDDLARLTRRASNLEAMATATQLTRAQFKVAIEHARSVSDRYREIQTLLLPIWRQSVGFDLFSRNTASEEK